MTSRLLNGGMMNRVLVFVVALMVLVTMGTLASA